MKNEYHVYVHGEGKAAAVSASLIARSIAFHLEPWPEDVWRFTVKSDGLHPAIAALQAAGG